MYVCMYVCMYISLIISKRSSQQADPLYPHTHMHTGRIEEYVKEIDRYAKADKYRGQVFVIEPEVGR